MIFCENFEILFSKIITHYLKEQSSHPGNAVEDIGRIISCSLTAKERRKNWRDILQYYYGKLAEKTQKHPPFLFEQVSSLAYLMASPQHHIGQSHLKDVTNRIF
uniref:Rab-GAP TBC domain-containing protein n=1 Tax=Ascaris lumbricoides TaxID=6252 RepID=A0A0M3HHL3_ASCLU